MLNHHPGTTHVDKALKLWNICCPESQGISGEEDVGKGKRVVTGPKRELLGDDDPDLVNRAGASLSIY